jgi:hypothetical protein
LVPNGRATVARRFTAGSAINKICVPRKTLGTGQIFNLFDLSPTI